MQKSLRSPFLAWPLIFIVTLLFFPLGYFMIWKRCRKGVGGSRDGIALVLLGVMLLVAFLCVLIPVLRGDFFLIDYVSAPYVPMIMICVLLFLGIPSVIICFAGFGCFGSDRAASSASLHDVVDDMFAYAAEELRRQRIMQAQKANKPDDMSVKCPYCGAYNRILRNELNSCEYCGTPLEWPDDE